MDYSRSRICFSDSKVFENDENSHLGTTFYSKPNDSYSLPTVRQPSLSEIPKYCLL